MQAEKVFTKPFIRRQLLMMKQIPIIKFSLYSSISFYRAKPKGVLSKSNEAKRSRNLLSFSD